MVPSATLVVSDSSFIGHQYLVQFNSILNQFKIEGNTVSWRIQTTHKLMMMNKPIKKNIHVRLGDISTGVILPRSIGRTIFRQITQHPLGKKNPQPNLTLILIGFMTFLVIAPGDLNRMASKVHHLMKGIFFRSSSETSSLSLPVMAERRSHVKITFHTCFDTGWHVLL